MLYPWRSSSWTSSSTFNQARASSLQALTWTQLEVVTQKSWREIEKLHPEEMRLCRSEIHRMLAERQQVA